MPAGMLTRDEVVALLAQLGQPMRARTWSAYTSRGQAPPPDERVGRTPLWREATILRFAATRPGRGARRNREPGHATTSERHPPTHRGDEVTDEDRAEIERLRALLAETLDGWEHSVTTGADGYYERSRIRREMEQS